MSFDGKKCIDKREAFFTAESFHRVAQDIIPNNCLDDENDDGHWFVPFLVNLAFAIEVYIKMIVMDQVIELPRKHEWSDLIQAMPQLLEELNNHPKLAGYESLNQKIKESERTFVDWRYFYEHDFPKCVDIVFLERFACTLHDLAEKYCLNEN